MGGTPTKHCWASDSGKVALSLRDRKRDPQRGVDLPSHLGSAANATRVLSLPVAERQGYHPLANAPGSRLLRCRVGPARFERRPTKEKTWWAGAAKRRWSHPTGFAVPTRRWPSRVVMELFPQKVRVHAAQVVLQNLELLHRSSVRAVFGTIEQAPPRLDQQGFVAASLQNRPNPDSKFARAVCAFVSERVS